VNWILQVLRIAVNDEFGALNAFLRALPGVLKVGRAVLLSFHSGEDRRVQKASEATNRARFFRLVEE
jgi:16S rRNA (cytosine1402-N4)-methyltransferase